MLPHTIELAIAAIILALTLVLPIGIVTAVKRNTWIDYTGLVGDGLRDVLNPRSGR